ncbi:hypothetical protein ABTK05_20210, partial [Acinetobacter baumannii]
HALAGTHHHRHPPVHRHRGQAAWGTWGYCLGGRPVLLGHPQRAQFAGDPVGPDCGGPGRHAHAPG